MRGSNERVVQVVSEVQINGRKKPEKRYTRVTQNVRSEGNTNHHHHHHHIFWYLGHLLEYSGGSLLEELDRKKVKLFGSAFYLCDV